MENNHTWELRLLEWELAAPGETEVLTTTEVQRVLENIGGFVKPVIIWTGRDILKRPDLSTVIAAGASQNFEMHIDPLTNDLAFSTVRQIAQNGIRSLVVRIDGPTADRHDRMHGVGDFDMAQATMEFSRQLNLPFSITTTINRENRDDLPLLLDLVIRTNAAAFHPYILIPENRKDSNRCLSAKEYEETLIWLARQRELVPSWFGYRPTCAPQYYRLLRQQEDPAHAMPVSNGSATAGCTGGRSFAFITSTGIIQTCGELNIAAGSLRTSNYDFRSIWEESSLFRNLRDENPYRGRCRQCEYRDICGGCRARAFISTGDYLAEEPLCAYEPGSDKKRKEGSGGFSSNAA